MAERVIIGAAELYLGDCRQVLPTLPRAAAVIADPPYGIKYVHSGQNTIKRGGLGGGVVARGAKVKPIIGDDQPFDPACWLDFPSVLLFGANHFAPRLPASGSWLVWDKSPGVACADSFVDSEFIWTSRPGIKRNVFRHLWKGLVADKVGEDLPGTNARSWSRHHPSMKPVALMEWCIATAAPDNNLIVDPYMGSGTTGVAAIRAGKRFIGCEMDPDYFAIACERIERAQRQVRIFA